AASSGRRRWCVSVADEPAVRADTAGSSPAARSLVAKSYERTLFSLILVLFFGQLGRAVSRRINDVGGAGTVRRQPGAPARLHVLVGDALFALPARMPHRRPGAGTNCPSYALRARRQPPVHDGHHGPVRAGSSLQVGQQKGSVSLAVRRLEYVPEPKCER